MEKVPDPTPICSIKYSSINLRQVECEIVGTVISQLQIVAVTLLLNHNANFEFCFTITILSDFCVSLKHTNCELNVQLFVYRYVIKFTTSLTVAVVNLLHTEIKLRSSFILLLITSRTDKICNAIRACTTHPCHVNSGNRHRLDNRCVKHLLCVPI